ncbi:hypothetical protein F9Y90_04825 (plasmid) [Borrelia miyamotoi]|uniref:Uncharacterized protein n=1 Tax=Borrelia miyamotoi TaxID=47466 RepID=A0A5P8AR49_9SPIR|nr:hypothetical protein [Borrelia miyamotoi]QFP42437.1 hypothetical protein F9Y90_04825 [Borrelia miyamotoi]WVI05303.1 hypothetical protein F9Y91_00275 [Borrelia miyamotoi]
MFLNFCIANRNASISFGIPKINKKSIFVNKYFQIHEFIEEMLFVLDKVKGLFVSIYDDEFIKEPTSHINLYMVFII